ncbi:hypothetical protein D3C80_1253830 [compost metagenome]
MEEGIDVRSLVGIAQHAVQCFVNVYGGFELLPAAQGLDMQREELAEHLGRHPLPHGQRARRIVMAGDHPPQLAVDDDRNRHRRAHTHVAQVLAMDGRDAAQVRVGEIERFARWIEHRVDGHRFELGV